jgi:hypothetical protein
VRLEVLGGRLLAGERGELHHLLALEVAANAPDVPGSRTEQADAGFFLAARRLTGLERLDVEFGEFEEFGCVDC